MDNKIINFFENSVFQSANAENVKNTEFLDYQDKKREQVLINVNIESNIPKRFKTVKFSDFEFNDSLKKFAISPNDGICLMTGTVGRGKTTALCCAIHERALNGLPAGYYFSDILLSVTLRSLRNFNSKESEFEFYKKLGTVEFLCLDEVGASKYREEEIEFIRTILMLRYDNEVPTMISTNMNGTEFKKFMLNINENITLEELNTKAKQDPVLDRMFSLVTSVNMVGNTSFREY